MEPPTWMSHLFLEDINTPRPSDTSDFRITSSWREADVAQEILEARFPAQRVKGIVNLQPGHVDVAFREGPVESIERLLLFAQRGIDHREIVSSNVTLFAACIQLVQNLSCVSFPPKCSVSSRQPYQATRTAV